MFIVDAHLDLAFNALDYGRELRQDLNKLRDSESEKMKVGRATVTFPELRKAGVGLVFGTLFVNPATSPHGSLGGKTVYRDSAEAHSLAMAQLDYYHRLADEEESVQLIGNLKDLEDIVASYEPGNTPQMGIVPLMEGADPIRRPEEVEYWYERGLRMIGLAWDNTRYAAGAWRSGNAGLTREGMQLLEVMSDFSFVLDLTHMSEQACYQALDHYQGPAVATHSNARVLVPGERQLSDTQIRLIGERDGVIGIVLSNAFLSRHYQRGDPKDQVTLQHVVAHIDHVCQILGDASHVGIGSDLDGGFGADDIPAEMDSIADLPLIATRLRDNGYEEEDVENIMGGNWLQLLRKAFS
jgi:membrane dipeptidase